MNLTYEEILENMKKAYFDECKVNVDNMSDLGKRFETVASELFALSCYGDYIFKQAFVQTATGEYLDRHGALRGCERKSKTQSQGVLRFYVGEDMQETVLIPADTVCSVEDKPYLQFATTQQKRIFPGTLYADVPAKSVGWGGEYNVGENEISVMVNAPTGILRVTNESAFYGGNDTETDDSLRKRIIKHYSVPPNGLNAQSVENTVTALDFVKDCKVAGIGTGGRLEVYVLTKNGTITKEERDLITYSISLLELIGVEVSIVSARAQVTDITVDIEVCAGFDNPTVSAMCREVLNELLADRKIGEVMELDKISCAVKSVAGVKNAQVNSSKALGGIVPCDADKYLYFNKPVVNCFGI